MHRERPGTLSSRAGEVVHKEHLMNRLECQNVIKGKLIDVLLWLEEAMPGRQQAAGRLFPSTSQTASAIEIHGLCAT